MSMTKIMVWNWVRGASRVSKVTSPGQSHISSGMTVLERVELVKGYAGDLRKHRRTRSGAW